MTQAVSDERSGRRHEKQAAKQQDRSSQLITRTVHSHKREDAECSDNRADDAEEDLAVGVGGHDGSSWAMGAVRDVVGCRMD